MTACIEDIDYRHPRGLERSRMAGLASCDWIRQSLNLCITGPTGCGKTWLACALAHQACLAFPQTISTLSSSCPRGRPSDLITEMKLCFPYLASSILAWLAKFLEPQILLAERIVSSFLEM